MSILEAIILGIIQGLTEFIPISSSGHLKIGESILEIQTEESLMFTVAVHGATVLSTLVVFRKEILQILSGFFSKTINENTHFVFKIAISMIPVAFIGLFFKDTIEAMFDSLSIATVGLLLIATGLILFFAWKTKGGIKDVGYFHSFWIGIAQAIAILPGISRSGATIGTALLLGIDRAKAARFSFLMVIVPILGEMSFDLLKGGFVLQGISPAALLAGFAAAFLSGLFACRFMIQIVTQGKLIYFAIYCISIGILVAAIS